MQNSWIVVKKLRVYHCEGTKWYQEKAVNGQFTGRDLKRGHPVN